jgi:hypothetical protein
VNGFMPSILITPATDYTTTIAAEGTPSITYISNTFTFNQGNLIAYYKFNNSSSLGLDSNPSTTKYNLTPTIVGGTGGYNSNIAIEGGSFQATNDGDYLEGDFPLKSIYEADLHHATIKVLQETMIKVETLELQIKELQSQINK